MAKPSNASPAGPPDFSEPWKLSDVVLVVEEQRFHVHRNTLAFWSPVFKRTFSSDFKEKNSDEIPLPGKKASEIKELLHSNVSIFERESHHTEEHPLPVGSCSRISDSLHYSKV